MATELHAFTPSWFLSNRQTLVRSETECSSGAIRTLPLFASNNDDDDFDEEEEDEVVDEASLGDWRKFRASLIDSGLPTKGEDNQGTTEIDRTPKKNKKKPVAEKNKELLKQQNEKLAQEEIWAHLVAEPEVGGLLCRMPLEAQIFWGEQGYWKEKLATELAMGFGTVHMSPAEKGLDEEDTKLQNKVAW